MTTMAEGGRGLADLLRRELGSTAHREPITVNVETGRDTPQALGVTVGIVPYDWQDPVDLSLPLAAGENRDEKPAGKRLIRYLITIWGAPNALAEATLLDACLATVGKHSLVQRPGATMTFRLIRESMSIEQLERLWRAFGQPYRLSIPVALQVA